MVLGYEASVTFVFTLFLESDKSYIFTNFVNFLSFYYFESSFLATHHLKSSDDFPLYFVVRINFLRLSVPRMPFYFFERDPITSVESEELEDEILESGRKVMTLDDLPILAEIPVYDHFVIRVCCRGFLERINSLGEDEYNYSQGENVHLFAAVS